MKGHSDDRSRRPVAVVTGGTAGVGRATVWELVRNGYDVAVLARGRDGLDATSREAEELGGRALAIATDVADAEAVETAAARIEAELGEIEVWVNNAMTTVFAPLGDITAREFRRATEVTYLGVVWGTMAALRRMRPRDRGTIVQVGSALAYRAIPLQSAYCGAKHAARGFTDSVRTELIHEGSGVRVTMVHLPAVNTPQFAWCRAKLPEKPQPVPPIYQPEVAAEAIVGAIGRGGREVWVGGSTYQAILGQKAVPGLLDRWLADAAWDGQLTEEALEGSRPGNLFEPVAGDPGAHGTFGGRARRRSLILEATERRGWVAAAALVGVAALAAAWVARDGDD